MAKRSRKAKITEAEAEQNERDRLAAHGEVVALEAPMVEVKLVGPHDEVVTIKGPIEDADVAKVEEEVKAPNSVVAPKFKERYISNARILGIKGKAAKRSNWDWLAQQIAEICLNDKHKIDIGAFTALLEANGVDHSRWTNRNKGWEGRFRMTGRVALQKIVANAGVLKVPNAEDRIASMDFIQKYQDKA